MSAEKILSPVLPKIRFSAIDRFRGYSTFYMIVGHALMFWLLPQEGYISGFFMLFAEVMGANAFILIAGVNMSISYSNYVRKIQANPENALQEKWNGRLQIWIRTGWVFILSCGFNAIGTAVTGGFTLWIWLVLQTMWVSRIISYPFLQLSSWVRFCIGCVFFVLANPIRILTLTQAPVLYDILFFQSNMNPLFPFVGFFFIGSAMGSWLDRWSQIRMVGINPRDKQIRHGGWVQKYFTARNLALLGIAFLGLSVLVGWPLEYSDLTPYLLSTLNTNPGVNIDALPAFLVHSNSLWSFFSIGCELIIFAAFLQHDMVKIERQITNNLTAKAENKENGKGGGRNLPNGLTLFGQQSLTVYLTHYALIFLGISNISFWQFIIIAIPIAMGYYALIWIWANGRGKGYTLDWLVGKTSDLLAKRIVQRYYPVQVKPLVNS